MQKIYLFIGVVLFTGLLVSQLQKNPASPDLTNPEIEQFISLLNGETEGLSTITNNWKPIYTPMTLEVLHFLPREIAQTLVTTMEKHTDQALGSDTNDWFTWLWNAPEIKAKNYDNFKSEFYKLIDPRFGTYFKDRADSALIRLDEIRWGGVRQDGIPPLRQPDMIVATEADYLEDDNVEVAGVYCTLCGAVILYETGGHDLGTSGFLYRSNKLMYDQATQSLWNTIRGEPVLGPLVGQDIALTHRQVVTTTWGEWKERHPDTQVLSLNTGHDRDYGEGVAYNEYFATDQLMFNTPFNDNRLQNKDEILALRFPAHPKEQLAIDTNFLSKNPVYIDQIGDQKLVVLTDVSGANRVYDPLEITFTAYDQKSTVTDSDGDQWTLTEHALTHTETGQTLESLPYHRAFWFGWHATFPESRLIK